MSVQPVSEKAIEILFNRCILQSFELGSVQLFAPTSVEEFERGYDGRIVGPKALREIYLQFKASSYSSSNARYTVKITRHQHAVLKAMYPTSSAYYVAPMFRSLEEFAEAQSSLTGAVANFLKHFVCLDIGALPGEVDFVNFQHPASHAESPEVKYKIPADGSVRAAQHPVAAGTWCRGSTLLRRFKDGQVGVTIGPGSDALRSPGVPKQTNKPLSFELTAFARSNFGVVLRAAI